MEFTLQLDYFRKEHQDVLGFLANWENTLRLLTSSRDTQRLNGLRELREMEGDLQAVKDHCSFEEHNLESRYRSYLQGKQLEQLMEEYEDIRRLVQDLHSDLQFASLETIEGLPEQGRRVAEVLRRHILLEEKLLDEIEQALTREELRKVFERRVRSAN